MKHILGMETGTPRRSASASRGGTTAPSGSLAYAPNCVCARPGLYTPDGDIPNLVTARSTRVVEGIPMGIQKLYTD